MLNSFIVEGEFDERHRGTGRRRHYLAFRKDLAQSLIDGFSSRKEVPARNLQVDRLNAFLVHLPQFVPENKECVLCTRRGRWGRRGRRHHSHVQCTSCECHSCAARDPKLLQGIPYHEGLVGYVELIMANVTLLCANVVCTI